MGQLRPRKPAAAAHRKVLYASDPGYHVAAFKPLCWHFLHLRTVETTAAEGPSEGCRLRGESLLCRCLFQVQKLRACRE